jgi:glutamate racemase
VETDTRPIAMLDSGVGGLSILREVRRQLPNEDILYFADQGHVPYGPRPTDEINQFLAGITRFFLARQAKVIVVACNTASAAGLHFLRAEFPEIPFVGMEPAVKPAAQNTHKGAIGVIATKTTSQSALFASVVDRFASDIKVVTQVCPDFVTLVEAGELDSSRAEQIARDYLKPLQDAEIDQLVLACTHFPFLMPLLQRVVGPDVAIIDPSPAIARQTGRIIDGQRNTADHQGYVSYYTSGDPQAFLRLAQNLLDEPVNSEQVHAAEWIQGDIHVVDGEAGLALSQVTRDI